MVWAQMISTRLNPGKEDQFPRLIEELRAIEQPDSGLVQTLAMRDQGDPSRMVMLVLFESEEKARAREADPRRAEGLQAIRALMTELFAGPPEFANLEVVAEHGR